MSSSWSIRNVRGARVRSTPADSPCAAAKLREPVAQLAVGVEQRIAELPGDAQQLVLVLVADADRHRHRHDAAVQAGPVSIDELLVARHVQDQQVAGPGADALQVMQDAERAPAQARRAAASSRRPRPRGSRSRASPRLRWSSISVSVWYWIMHVGPRVRGRRRRADGAGLRSARDSPRSGCRSRRTAGGRRCAGGQSPAMTDVHGTARAAAGGAVRASRAFLLAQLPYARRLELERRDRRGAPREPAGRRAAARGCAAAAGRSAGPGAAAFPAGRQADARRVGRGSAFHTPAVTRRRCAQRSLRPRHRPRGVQRRTARTAPLSSAGRRPRRCSRRSAPGCVTRAT